MRMRGTWPGSVTLRSGWAKAVARPWNPAVPDAALRLERGSAEFLADCATFLCGLGVARVLTPPLDDSSRRVWEEAGFVEHLRLDLHSRQLAGSPPPPSRPVQPGTDADWDLASRIDDAAFEPAWRMGRLGLEEAHDATARAAFLVVREATAVTGFVVVGAAVGTAYLQRLAVDPGHQRVGIGRDLVRGALAWATAEGAIRIVLNTQADNLPAAALYRSEGFSVAHGALAVLARGC